MLRFQQSILPESKFSPTYLSTDALSPLRTPYRSTVPKIKIIAGGTTINHKQCNWGTSTLDYGGIGKYTLFEDFPKFRRKLELPRSHRHYISANDTVLHGVVQPQTVTGLLRSNCRQNDQFINPPHLINNIRVTREENKFVQEPSYSSHICRNAMFPLSVAEGYKVLPKNGTFAPSLSEKTSNALAKVVKNRYKSTSYERDFENPATGEDIAQEQNVLEERELIRQSNQTTPKIQVSHVKSLQALARNALLGSWPCWPVGTRSIISTVTGQIIEKRDVVSLDDLRDYRIYRRCYVNSKDKIKESRRKFDKEWKTKDCDAESDTEETVNQESNMQADEDEKLTALYPTPPTTDMKARCRRNDKKWKRSYKISPPILQHWMKNRAEYSWTEDFMTSGMTTEMLRSRRAEDMLYLLLQSVTKKDQNKKEMTFSENVAAVKSWKIERRDHPVLLPPDPLHKALSYSGNRIADRLGVRFKTVALKRYHGIHPETVPDLREFRPPIRKCKFLGYHTSMFR